MSITSSIDIAPASYQPLSAGGRAKLDKKVVQVSGARGTTGRAVQFTIQNIGTGYLRFDANSFKFTGTDASQFIVASGLPSAIPPGKRRSFTIALKPSSTASVTRVLTASMSITQTGTTTAIAAIAVRGLATTGEGGDKEPSLARILELFQYDINDGDTDPNTTELTISGTTDQVSAPRFVKAGSGNITIDPVAQFANRTTTVAGLVGTYEPGTPNSRTTLFNFSGADSQTVNPVANGSTAFDPGTRQFSLWAEAPTFIDNGQPRIIYGEDALNTWETNPAKTNKVRVYPFKQNGVVEANAYLVAFEEYSASNDQNDYVFVIHNVTVSKSQPELGLITLEGQNDPERLAFNRITNVNADIGNRVKDVSKVRLINTGSKDLVISRIQLNASSTDFQLVNVPSTITLKRNQTYDLTVKFVSESGDLHHATLVLTTNDRDEPTKTIALSGFWQSDSEQNSQGIQQEPTLSELVDVLGYKTTILKSGQVIQNRGKVEAVGDEVLSDSWSAADPSQPVYVQELAGFHSQGHVDQIAWYPTGHPYYGMSDPRYDAATNGDRNIIFENNANDGQTLFPRAVGSESLAQGSFKPGTTTFGLRVNGELTDDELNLTQPGDLGGHHWRFFPAKDENNNIIPDTFLATVDFSSINFDYNDHLLLVKNIRPSDRPPTVTGFTGFATPAGSLFNWAAVPGAVGYAVLRAVKPDDTFVRITTDVLTTTTYTDTRAPADRTRYYEVAALFSNGKMGLPSPIIGIRLPKAT